MVLALQLCPPVAAEDLQVNTYTTAHQDWPSVAVHSTGAFVVVWASWGSSETDTDLTSVQGRRFISPATPIAAQFQVNNLTAGHQLHSGVSMDADGDFVVVWDDSAHGAIRGQRYASSGASVGAEFQVNTVPVPLPDADFSAGFPGVGMDDFGGFVVVWNDDATIQGQRFAPSGSAIGSQFRVDTYTSKPGYPLSSDVAMAGNGDFVIVWSSYASPAYEGERQDVKARLYMKSGAPIGAEFLVNSYTTGDQVFPGVAVDYNANFVVVWHSDGSSGSDSDSLSVRAQRFSANGASIGAEFLVNSYTTSNQGFASVAMNGTGQFVVTWVSRGSWGSDSDELSVQGQRYAASAAPIGGQFQINTYVTGAQTAPSVALDDAGELVVAWVSHGSSGTDTENGSIQVFVSRIFSGGFESGGTGGWSAAVP